MKKPAYACCLLLSLVTLADAAAAGRCMPQVRDGWIRLTPGLMSMSAGYGRIDNPCDAPITLVRVDSQSFADVSMHQTRIEHGVSRMRPIAQLAIGAHRTVELAPGGVHLMLMEPSKALAPGQQVPVDFETSDGRRIRGVFDVRAMH